MDEIHAKNPVYVTKGNYIGNYAFWSEKTLAFFRTSNNQFCNFQHWGSMRRRKCQIKNKETPRDHEEGT